MSEIAKVDFNISADYVINLGVKLERQEQDIENLININKILIEHIAELDKRSRKFSDKFKFGSFRFKTLKEKIDSKKLHLENKKIKFNLNDD